MVFISSFGIYPVFNGRFWNSLSVPGSRLPWHWRTSWLKNGDAVLPPLIWEDFEQALKRNRVSI